MKKPAAADRIVQRVLGSDGNFPNNARLPLLFYPAALTLPERDSDRMLEELFAANGWTRAWRNGIFGYHHYHSTAHEVLGVYSGTALVQLGGPGGPEFDIRPADVIVIPAGVAHKNMGADRQFRVVGAYPVGQQWDMKTGKTGERPQVDRNIAAVALPALDPVFGPAGPLTRLWHAGR
jgi:uncharacterized protein YjlB